MTEKITPLEAIDEYYRLKDKYKTKYYEDYIKPIINSKKSKREKRVEYSKLPKPQCINCKRNVGTIFKIKPYETEFNRKFIVICGDMADPCPLDIQINYSMRELFDKSINESIKDMEEVKLKIIKEKNNALFFDKDVSKSFEDLTSELKLYSENTGFAIETNILRNNNPVKHDLIKKEIDEFGKGNILPFKQMIKQYLETNNEIILNQAVNFYINEMMPKVKEIRNLKYDINLVEYNIDSNNFQLIQLPNSLENQEFYYKSDDKVLRYIKGVKKVKTRKNMEKTQNKTLKNIASKELIILDDEIEKVVNENEEENEDENEGEKIIISLPKKIQEIKNETGVPIYEGNNVIWENEAYQQLWNNFPEKMKNWLLTDHPFLENYMRHCYISRENGQPCRIVIPNFVKIPPEKKPNGFYDFNSSLINKLFSYLPESYQNTLLSLYSEKDGVKNYDMLKNAIAEILEKELYDYKKGYY